MEYKHFGVRANHNIHDGQFNASTPLVDKVSSILLNIISGDVYESSLV